MTKCGLIAALISSSIALSVPSSLVLAQDLSNSSFNVHGNDTNTATFRLGSRSMCRPSEFGHNLDLDSCEQALSKMPRSPIERYYAPRSANYPGAVPLPLRYLSDDGACAIDILEIRRASAGAIDMITEQSMAAQAGLLVDSCVRDRGQGGFVGSFSKYKCPTY